MLAAIGARMWEAAWVFLADDEVVLLCDDGHCGVLPLLGRRRDGAAQEVCSRGRTVLSHDPVQRVGQASDQATERRRADVRPRSRWADLIESTLRGHHFHEPHPVAIMTLTLPASPRPANDNSHDPFILITLITAVCARISVVARLRVGRTVVKIRCAGGRGPQCNLASGQFRAGQHL